jgi:hypothetical protein
MMLPKTERLRAPRHVVFVRSLRCLVPGCCGDEIHAHNIRKGTPFTMHPLERGCVPVCLEHREEGLSGGWRDFEIRYGLRLFDIADGLWLASQRDRRGAAWRSAGSSRFISFSPTAVARRS